MAEAEERDDQRHRADLAEPWREEPGEIAAKQQLFADAGGDREADKPAFLSSGVRQHERDVSQLGLRADATRGREPRDRPELQDEQPDRCDHKANTEDEAPTR